MSLEGKTVLITGATGGLGRGVTRVLAETAVNLALVTRNRQELEQLAGDLGLSEDRTLLFAGDLSSADAVAALGAAIEKRWGGVDVLLNLIGGWTGGTAVGDLTDEDWDRMMVLNLRTAFLLNRMVLPHMVSEGWGRIVNVGSRSAVEPGRKQAPYNVSKAGVVALTQSVARDYGRQGVTANVILPSTIDTPANRENMPDKDFSRWVQPEDIGAAMLYLCGEAARAVNGAAIPIYGQA
jgi:NAD(P)-dependent dehydrogenase (short-subunit alcohol dehydrogenase family)